MDAALLSFLLPVNTGVRITALTVESTAVVADLVTTTNGTACPPCGFTSTTRHGRYHRTVRDRPCLGVPVAYAVTARKFVCCRT